VYDIRMNLGDSGIDLHVPLPGEDLLFEGNGSNTGQGYWSDDSTPAAYPATISPEDAVFRDQNQNVVFLDDKTSSSENMADSPSSLKDDETDVMDSINEVNHLTKAIIEDYGRDNVYGRGGVIENGLRNYRETYSEQTSGIQGILHDRSYTENGEEKLEVAIEEGTASLTENKDYEEGSVTVMEGDPFDEGTLNFSRVVLETEIKLNEDAAIMMTILEEGNTSPQEELYPDEPRSVDNSEEYAEEERETGADDEGCRMYNNNFIMKVLTDDEDYNDDDDVAVPDQPIRRTPRRVRFGGEMVMMRTPDSEEATVQQQHGDSNPSQDNVNGGCSEAERGPVEGSTVDGAIQAIIPDTRRDSTICTNDNSLDESSRRKSVSCTRGGSRGQSVAQEALDNEKQDMLEDSKREPKEGTVTEIKQNSEDGTRLHSVQDSPESSLRWSIHEAKQDSVETLPFGSTGGGTRKSSVEDCLGYTRCSPNEASKRDSVTDGRVLAQHRKRELLGDGRRGSTEDARQDSRESVGQETAQDTKQGSVENGAEERVRDVMETVTQTTAGDVGQKDEEISFSLQSHIPVPIIPARSKPKDHKRRGSLCRQRQDMRDSYTQQQSSDLAEHTQLKQGPGESVDGTEDDGRETSLGAPEAADRRGDFVVHKYTDQNWEELGIVTESVLEDLHDQVR
jgi:hypothetical protein